MEEFSPAKLWNDMAAAECSLEDLADAVGVEQATVAKWLSGERVPRPAMQRAISRILNPAPRRREGGRSGR